MTYVQLLTVLFGAVTLSTVPGYAVQSCTGVCLPLAGQVVCAGGSAFPALSQGRDANRKLQRAIRAGKARERMPALVQHMHSLLDGWMEEQGGPFLYNGRDYKASLLAPSCSKLRHRSGAWLHGWWS